jgi:hypothetical protein
MNAAAFVRNGNWLLQLSRKFAGAGGMDEQTSKRKAEENDRRDSAPAKAAA